jgi:antitoxin ParD1/3/4
MQWSRASRLIPTDRPDLPRTAKVLIFSSMTTIHISVPEALKSFVDEQVLCRGYDDHSDYVRELIRKD